MIKREKKQLNFEPKGEELQRRIAEVQAKWSEKDRQSKDCYRKTVGPVHFRKFAPTNHGLKQID